MVVSGPCPGCTIEASPSANSTSVIDRISTSWLPPGRSVRPIEPANKRIADEQVLARLALFSDLQANSPRAVAGRVVHADLVIAKIDRAQVVVDVDRRRLADREPEYLPLLDRVFVQRQVVLVEVNRYVSASFTCATPVM